MRSRVEAIKEINEKIYLANQKVQGCTANFKAHSENINNLAVLLENHPGNTNHLTPVQQAQLLAAQSQSLFPGGEAVYVDAYFDLYVSYLQALRQYGFVVREMMSTIDLLSEVLRLIDQEHTKITAEDQLKSYPAHRKSDSVEFQEFFHSICSWMDKQKTQLYKGLQYFDEMMSEAAGDVVEVPIYRFSILRKLQSHPEVSHWMKPWYENTRLDEPQREVFPTTLLKALATLPALIHSVPHYGFSR